MILHIAATMCRNNCVIFNLLMDASGKHVFICVHSYYNFLYRKTSVSTCVDPVGDIYLQPVVGAEENNIRGNDNQACLFILPTLGSEHAPERFRRTYKKTGGEVFRSRSDNTFPPEFPGRARGIVSRRYATTTVE